MATKMATIETDDGAADVCLDSKSSRIFVKIGGKMEYPEVRAAKSRNDAKQLIALIWGDSVWKLRLE